jgi:hypothetical protein
VKVCRHVHLRRSRRRQSLQFVRAQSDTLARFEPRAGFPSRGLTPPSHSPTYHTFMRYLILPNNPSRVSSAAQKQWDEREAPPCHSARTDVDRSAVRQQRRDVYSNFSSMRASSRPLPASMRWPRVSCALRTTSNVLHERRQDRLVESAAQNQSMGNASEAESSRSGNIFLPVSASDRGPGVGARCVKSLVAVVYALSSRAVSRGGLGSCDQQASLDAEREMRVCSCAPKTGMVKVYSSSALPLSPACSVW